MVGAVLMGYLQSGVTNLSTSFSRRSSASVRRQPGGELLLEPLKRYCAEEDYARTAAFTRISAWWMGNDAGLIRNL